jgi:hypothetical protein
VLVIPIQDSTQATQDRGILDPFAQKIVRKPGTGFAEKFTSYVEDPHKRKDIRDHGYYFDFERTKGVT